MHHTVSHHRTTTFFHNGCLHCLPTRHRHSNNTVEAFEISTFWQKLLPFLIFLCSLKDDVKIHASQWPIYIPSNVRLICLSHQANARQLPIHARLLEENRKSSHQHSHADADADADAITFTSATNGCTAVWFRPLWRRCCSASSPRI